MRFLSKLFLATLLAIASFLPALGETRDVPAGRPSVIGFYYTYTRDTCSYGSKPKFKVTLAPEHGNVTAKWQGYKMGKEARNCNGKQMYGMMIIYSPHKGFHGKDVVKFTLSGSGVYPGPAYSIGRGFRIDVNVR